jgi:hypothetical protein
MKKVLIMALMTLVAMSVNAQALVVKSGNLATMLQKDKTAALKIDFSKAKMANLSKKELKETLFMDFLKESDPETYQIWDKHAKECYDFFAERWNDDKASAKIDDDKSADYTINVKFDYIDIGNGAAATWSWSRKSGGVMMRCTVQITDANGNDVCTVDVNDFRGNSTRGFDMKMPTFGRRMALFHKSLAKELLDLAKEQKK